MALAIPPGPKNEPLNGNGKTSARLLADSLSPPPAGLPAALDHLFRDDFTAEHDSSEDVGLLQLLARVEAFPPSRDAGPAQLCDFRELLLDAAHGVLLRWKTVSQFRSLLLTDDLTGLYNRRGFLFMATQHLKLARRTGQHLLLFFMDVDNLKFINDDLGHIKGDAFLICCANALKQTFRETDILARFGGDEFVVLVHEGVSRGPSAILRRLEKSLHAVNRNVPGPHRLSLSAGTSSFDPRNPLSLTELLNRADRRMYDQKRARLTIT